MSPRLLFIRLIELYQAQVSPLLGMRCRFYPSCSHYALGCLEKNNLLVASCRIVGRLCRCQPWHKGGFDYP